MYRRNGTGLGKSSFDIGLNWFEMFAVFSATMWIVYRLYYGINASWGFTTDDAWIPLRYSRNLIEGAGVAWNAGESAVEGYSSFIYVLFGAVALFFDVSPIVTYKVIGIGSAIASLIGMYILARQWVRPIFAIISPVVLVSYYGYSYWVVAGLETSFYIFCYVFSTLSMVFGLSALQLETVSERKLMRAKSWPICAGLTVFIAAVTRPEGPVVGITLGLPLLLAILYYRFIYIERYKNRLYAIKLLKVLVLLTVSAVIPFAFYFLWRYISFDRVFANTVYCKAWSGGDPRRLVDPFLVIATIPALFALVRWPRGLQFKDLFLVLPALIYLYLIYGANPLIGQYNRHVLAAFSLLLVAAVVGLSDICKLIPWRGFSVLLGGGTLLFWIDFIEPVADTVANLEENARSYEMVQNNRTQTVEWVNKHLGPEDTWAIGDVGITGFLSTPKVMDVYCINNIEMTKEGRRHKGEDTATMIMENAPEIIALSSRDPEKLIPISIWKELIKRNDFHERYTKVKVFGFPGNPHNYWLYQRNDWVFEQDRFNSSLK